jgi:hypothetical protein
MRRDVYIDNDSGGFSVIAAEAADAIIADDRNDDVQFADAHQVLLQMLYGDDALPVRIVVDEPLREDESAQWLARTSARIDTSDGRLLVMGGFDPWVLSTWQEEHGPDEDGRGVAVVPAAPGSWRVDLYAHAGSMNGRNVLSEGGEPPGAFFRRCHPGRAFPVWLAKMLEHSGEDDPGFEELWSDVAASREDGQLDVDTSSASAIGMLVHVTRLAGDASDLGDGGWYDFDEGKRVPEVFPLGLPAAVPDPDLEAFLDRLLRRPKPVEEIPVASELVSVVDAWSGAAPAPLAGGEYALAPEHAHLLYWMTALCADSSPRYELRVTPNGAWTPPAPSPEVAVIARGDGSTALGPPPDAGGWLSWWSARKAAEALAGVPEGSALCLAIAPDAEGDAAREIGRALYRGSVRGGAWQIAEASPALAHETLADALAFVREIALHDRIPVRGDDERRAFDASARMSAIVLGAVVWDDDRARLADPEERGHLMLATPVFRTRFAAQWPCDPVDLGDDE